MRLWKLLLALRHLYCNPIYTFKPHRGLCHWNFDGGGLIFLICPSFISLPFWFCSFGDHFLSPDSVSVEIQKLSCFFWRCLLESHLRPGADFLEFSLGSVSPLLFLCVNRKHWCRICYLDLRAQMDSWLCVHCTQNFSNMCDDMLWQQRTGKGPLLTMCFLKRQPSKMRILFQKWIL